MKAKYYELNDEEATEIRVASFLDGFVTAFSCPKDTFTGNIEIFFTILLDNKDRRLHDLFHNER